MKTLRIAVVALATILSGCAVMSESVKRQDAYTHANSLPPADKAIALAELSMTAPWPTNQEQRARFAYFKMMEGASALLPTNNQVEISKLQAYVSSHPELVKASRQYSEDDFSVSNLLAMLDLTLPQRGDKNALRQQTEKMLAHHSIFVGPTETKAIQDRITVFLSSERMVQVASTVWSTISPSDQKKIASRFAIDVLPSNTLGIIFDAQSVDKSTRPTNDGAALGAAIGSTAYIDRSIKPNTNYSAKSHLGAGVLGALVGGSMDSPGQTLFLHRYTLKILDGTIAYHETEESSSLRHSIGICFSTKDHSIKDQFLCTEDREGFRRRIRWEFDLVN